MSCESKILLICDVDLLLLPINWELTANSVVLEMTDVGN